MVTGAWEDGANVAGACVPGPLADVGETEDGACVVGLDVTTPTGVSVVGECDTGCNVVGEWDDGVAVEGATVEGATVVGAGVLPYLSYEKQKVRPNDGCASMPATAPVAFDFAYSSMIGGERPGLETGRGPENKHLHSSEPSGL